MSEDTALRNEKCFSFEVKKNSLFAGFIFFHRVSFGEGLYFYSFWDTHWCIPFLKVLKTPLSLKEGTRIEGKANFNYRKISPEYALNFRIYSGNKKVIEKTLEW